VPAVEQLRRVLAIKALWPLWVAVAALLILLPGLGSHGFWEPQEISVADQAKRRLERYPLTEITATVAAQYKSRPSDLSNRDKTEGTLPRARQVAAYLARQYTVEPDFEVAQACGLADAAAIDEAVDAVRSDLDSDTALHAALDAVIAKLDDMRDKREASQRQTRPDLTERVVARGMAWRQDELGARLPLALLGLLALAATFYLGFRLGGARAGLLSALIMLGMPLFILQSRQLTSDIGAITGSTLLMAGLAGLAWPAEGRALHRLWLYPVDALLVAVGAVISYAATGALLGLVPVVGGVALASLVALIADRGPSAFSPGTAPAGGAPLGERNWRLIHLLIAASLATIACLVLLEWVLAATFDIGDPKPGAGQLFGAGIIPSPDYVPALGGVWKSAGNLERNFDSVFEQIAFGAFPWIALGPIALAHLAMGGRRGRRAWAGYLMFGWASIAWAVATVMNRKVGPVHYPALAALATGIALWLDDLIAARRWGEADDGPRESLAERVRARFGVHPVLPLAALFTAAAAVVLGKDLQEFAEQMTSVHILGSKVTYPKDLLDKLDLLVLAFGFAVPIGLALWLWVPRRPRIGSVWVEFPAFPALMSLAYLLFLVGLHREIKPVLVVAALLLIAGVVSLLFLQPRRRRDYFAALAYRLGRTGIPTAVGVVLVGGLWLAHCWTPDLSGKLSSKDLFAAYQKYRQPGDRLGVMGTTGSGPKYYAGGTFTRIDDRNELMSFLGDSHRSFALVPASELCPLHRSARGKFDYAVLDDSNASFLLIANQLPDGASDRNRLARTILRDRPPAVGDKVIASYDDKIELVGVDMPRQVSRGSSFQMTLYFRVVHPVGGSWKLFVHFDGGGLRFQGDHDPVETVRCGTNFWQEGDYIVDRFTVTAGDVSYEKTAYTARVGFFQGASGNWKNMKVIVGPKDDNDRVPVGTIMVR